MSDMANITVDIGEDKVTVVGHGEMNLHTASEFRDSLRSAATSAETVVVDLRSVHFIDSAIIAGLVEAGKKMKHANRELTVIVASGSHPEYSLRIIGLKVLINIVSNCDPTED